MRVDISLKTGDGTRESIPERRLFAAVLHQAYMDATSHDKYWEDVHTRTERRRARRFLTTDSTWFRQVCELANIEAEPITAHARALAAKGWACA